MIKDSARNCLHHVFIDLGYILETFQEGGWDYEAFEKRVIDIEGRTKYIIAVEVSDQYVDANSKFGYVFDVRFKTAIGNLIVRHRLDGDNISAVERFLEEMYVKLGCIPHE